jgi:hypothetical protein
MSRSAFYSSRTLKILFVSGGAEHQGPDGGGPVAVIAECAGS